MPLEKSKGKSMLKRGDARPKLTKREAEILSLFTVERLTPKQIAARNKLKNPNSVYTHLNSLRNKGYLTKSNNLSKGIGGGVPLEPLETVNRLEAQQLVGRILFKDERYDRIRSQGNFLPDVDGVYVRLNVDSVELYLNKVFYGGGDWGSIWSDSLSFIERVIRVLENRLHVVLIKAGVANWRFVKVGEHAVEGELLAVRAMEDGHTLRLFNKRDGKLWYEADWSVVIEGETKHPERSKMDREAVDRHMWDWSENPSVPTLSELSVVLRGVLSAQERLAVENVETASGLKSVVDLLRERNKPPVIDAELFKGVPDYVG